MTVSELIAELKKLPAAYTVKIADWSEGYMAPTENFRVTANGEGEIDCVVLGEQG